MSRTLVVFHSRTGTTRRIARAIATRLDADTEEIRLVQPLDGWLGAALCALESIARLTPALRNRRRSLAAYDLVVVGTPVWFWNVCSPVRSWLEQHPLHGRRIAFFCTMGGSGADGAFASMEAIARRAPVATLALTADAVAAGARGEIDAFVHRLRHGVRRARRAAAPRALAHA